MVDFEKAGCEMLFIGGEYLIPESDKKEMITDYFIYWMAQLVAHYIITQDSGSRNTMSFARLNSLYYLASRKLFLESGEFLAGKKDRFLRHYESNYLFSDLLKTSLINVGATGFLNISYSRLYANIPLVFYDRLNDIVFTAINKLPCYEPLTLTNKRLEAVDKIIEQYKNTSLYILIEEEIKELPEYKDLISTDSDSITYTGKDKDKFYKNIFLEDYIPKDKKLA